MLYITNIGGLFRASLDLVRMHRLSVLTEQPDEVVVDYLWRYVLPDWSKMYVLGGTEGDRERLLDPYKPYWVAALNVICCYVAGNITRGEAVARNFSLETGDLTWVKIPSSQILRVTSVRFDAPKPPVYHESLDVLVAPLTGEPPRRTKSCTPSETSNESDDSATKR